MYCSRPIKKKKPFKNIAPPTPDGKFLSNAGDPVSQIENVIKISANPIIPLSYKYTADEFMSRKNDERKNKFFENVEPVDKSMISNTYGGNENYDSTYIR